MRICTGMTGACVSGLMGGVGWMFPVAAPGADTSEADAASDQLAEIIVTAQKRAQDIKDVPLSISVVGGDMLQEEHITSYEDISRIVPSVSFQSGGGPGLDNIAIRGISSTSGAATVALYLDEVPITVKNLWLGAIEPKLFDIDRVEVLRGPQGTLYGSSAMGGAIRMIGNQPNLTEFEGSSTLDVSSTHHGGINDEVLGILNLPLRSGVSALRLAADYTMDSGYIDNYSPEGQLLRRGVNSDHTAAARISLLIKPDDAISITPSMYYMHMTTDDTSVYYPSLGLWNQNKIVPEPGKINLSVPSLTINVDLGWADLTSITSYFLQQFDRTGDATYYNSEYLGYLINADPILGVKNVGNLFGDLPGPEYQNTSTSQWSQEIRLASKPGAQTGGFLSWLVGLYYSDQKVNRFVDDYVNGFDKLFVTEFGYPPQDSSLFAGQSFPNDAVALAGLQTKDDQYAVFGELGYNFTNALKGTAGLRYSHGKATFTEEESGYFAGNAPSVYQDTATASATTPRFSLTYDVDQDVNVYGTIAKGFRLGGAGEFVPSTICANDLALFGLTSAPTSYGSDSLWSYEVGSKGRVLDRRLTFSVAGYYIVWKDIQETINLPTCGYTITTNVGDAKSYGSEVDVAAKVTPNWTVGIAGGTTHATLTRVITEVGANVGDHILNTPDWTLSLHSEYVHRLNAGADLFLRGIYSWTGTSYGSFTPVDPDHVRPSYSWLDGSVGTDIGTLRLALYGKNILNDTKIIQHPSLLFLEEAYTLRPRTIGLMATKKF